MDTRMAYLLGMIYGNGEVKRGNDTTTISIDIPHKKQLTEAGQDAKLYVKASLEDIRKIIEPIIGVNMKTSPLKAHTILSFKKDNSEYVITEIWRFVGSVSASHGNMILHNDVGNFTRDEKLSFLRGFSDVTGYIRRSNYPFKEKHMHRVYLEIPHNWDLVAGIANLLKSIGIPIQTIDWAHPNMRDGNLKKYNAGYPLFWKKEHQIKIYANEFLPVGFSVIHKQDALDTLSKELLLHGGNGIENKTHRFYWDIPPREKLKPSHPAEHDSSLPKCIRGKHYNSWRQISRDMGYDKKS